MSDRYGLKMIVLCGLLLFVGQVSAQQLDSLPANRFLTRCVQYGAGYTNVFDTFLSSQEYTGVDFRIARETMRFTKKYSGHVSIQNFFQADVSYTHNRVDNNNTFAGMVNWNYGFHYQFRLSDNFKLLAGALSDMNLGFIYNLRNSNNPASLRAFVNLDASGMAIWHFKIKERAMTLRYQLNIPILGVMFSPEMGESYYEIFTLGNDKGVVKLTSLNNQPSLRQFLSLDMPIGSHEIRLSYLGDIQQSHVNGIKTHMYSHVFMVGVVRKFYSMRHKDVEKLSPELQAY